MARPLEKLDQNGQRLTRVPSVEKQIDVAVQQATNTVVGRAGIPDGQSADFLDSEALVNLIRDARKRGDDQTMGRLLTPLLLRCEAILLSQVPDNPLFDAATIRDEVLSDFSVLFPEDGSGENPHKLDYFECRFNRAFRFFYLDRVRREIVRLKHIEPQPRNDRETEVAPDEDVITCRSKNSQPLEALVDEVYKKVIEGQNKTAVRTAINALPSDERRAIILCCELGLKEESNDPSEITAAKRCNVTGRTIRNRLSRAKAKLAYLNEDTP